MAAKSLFGWLGVDREKGSKPSDGLEKMQERRSKRLAQRRAAHESATNNSNSSARRIGRRGQISPQAAGPMKRNKRSREAGIDRIKGPAKLATHALAMSSTRMRGQRAAMADKKRFMGDYVNDIGCIPGRAENVLPWASDENLVPGPAERNASLPAYQRTPPQRCAIIVDRHVHKNGGSTMRDFFLELERLGYGLYTGYSQMRWAEDGAVLSKLAMAAAKRGAAPRHLIMMEAHFGYVEFADSVMPQLQSVERIYQTAKISCPLVLVTRVREPLAYYISFFKWGVAGRQAKDPKTFGHNFTGWASQVPNLQSTIMTKGMMAMPAEYYGRFPNSARVRMSNEQAWEQVSKLLDQFTLVGTVKRFDETLLLASDLTGLPLFPYKRNKPTNKMGFRGSTKAVCPDLDACREHVRRVAPVDHLMYDKYASLFEARLQTLGPEFAKRVSAFSADVDAVAAKWQRAPRKQTICRFHPEASLSVPELQTSNLRCPIHDSMELCQRVYAHRLFECPWQYRANSTLSDPLGCWRKSSGFN